mmetsp:Transcript_104741/g.295087  ORF Transcript_104741/g.295087 Transcript_104741/m.295087 type:complete len:207 (-) Transcript_104741:170-790(-)
MSAHCAAKLRMEATASGVKAPAGSARTAAPCSLPFWRTKRSTATTQPGGAAWPAATIDVRVRSAASTCLSCSAERMRCRKAWAALVLAAGDGDGDGEAAVPWLGFRCGCVQGWFHAFACLCGTGEFSSSGSSFATAMDFENVCALPPKFLPRNFGLDPRYFCMVESRKRAKPAQKKRASRISLPRSGPSVVQISPSSWDAAFAGGC